MKNHLFFLLVISIINIEFTQAQTELTDSFNIQSSVLNEVRTCLIQLPENYATSGNESQTYPLIILLDGATFFQTTGEIVRFMSSQRNRNYLMPEAIIVAIENIDRLRDFTVTKIETKRGNTSGGGKNFLTFIKSELLPYIESNYRTENHRTLIGHSLGGLLALNSFMDTDSPFDAFVCLDPSIWWNEKQTNDKVESVKTSSFSKKLYIATANQGEEKYERNKKRHDLLFSLLIKKAGNSDFATIEYFENEDHRSVPLKGIYEGLKFVFEDW